MSQAKVAGPPWGRASRRSKLRECLRRQWPDHLSSGHLGTESSDDADADASSIQGEGEEGTDDEEEEEEEEEARFV